MKTYYTYILTNFSKTVLYVGITNSLSRRLVEHYENRGTNQSFAGKYHCYYLVYYETFHSPIKAIQREKEIKKWSRKKKVELIESSNPNWDFLNASFVKGWKD
ncbi:MAG: GIY-YIG nuclease family protein [Bacteroidia bacterium]